MHEHLIKFLKEEGFSDKETAKKPDFIFSHVAEIMQKYATQQLILHGVVQAKPEKVCEHIFKKSYGRVGGEKCIKCGKRI